MPTFKQLWDSHPSTQTPPEHFPCVDGRGKVHPALENQCAIRLGLALAGAGIDTSKIPGRRCWNNHGKRHILNTSSLVAWLDRNTALVGCKPKVVGRKVTFKDYLNKRGICYFKNFYGRNNQGDHIDLWQVVWMAHGAHDYFSRSEEVWFWEM